jgi:hypothetical protein
MWRRYLGLDTGESQLIFVFHSSNFTFLHSAVNIIQRKQLKLEGSPHDISLFNSQAFHIFLFFGSTVLTIFRLNPQPKILYILSFVSPFCETTSATCGIVTLKPLYASAPSTLSFPSYI